MRFKGWIIGSLFATRRQIYPYWYLMVVGFSTIQFRGRPDARPGLPLLTPILKYTADGDFDQLFKWICQGIALPRLPLAVCRLVLGSWVVRLGSRTSYAPFRRTAACLGVLSGLGSRRLVQSIHHLARGCPRPRGCRVSRCSLLASTEHTFSLQQLYVSPLVSAPVQTQPNRHPAKGILQA